MESISSGVTVFKETWQLPSYLIAFVVSDFQCTAKTGKQRICAPPNRMDEVGQAVEASDKILTWMEQTFDEPYEHEKLDHIAIPTFQVRGAGRAISQIRIKPDFTLSVWRNGELGSYRVPVSSNSLLTLQLGSP